MSGEPVVVNDARELLALAELTDVRFYEVSATRTGEDNEAHEIQIVFRHEDLELEVRCRGDVRSSGGSYISDVGAVFTLQRPVDAQQHVIEEFVEKVGVMSVYPYLRESISEGAAKLSLNRPFLRLLRAGDVHITRRDSKGEVQV